MLQEAYIELARRLPDYAQQQNLSFFLWVRLVTGQRLMQVHRRHLGAAMRDAGRDLTLYSGALPEASSMSLAAHLLGRLTTASHAAIRAELQLQLQEILNGMEPIDREVLACGTLRISRTTRSLKCSGSEGGRQQTLCDRTEKIAGSTFQHSRICEPKPSGDGSVRCRGHGAHRVTSRTARGVSRGVCRATAARRAAHDQGICREVSELAAEIRELFPASSHGRAQARRGRCAAASNGWFSLQRTADGTGDYWILREVGRGGMGIVYEAEQESLGRRVALKVLPNRLLVNEKQKKRFEHEARTAARLHHTNIVPVFGIGQHDGVCYYVMQFIQGQGLEEVLVEVRRLRDRASSPTGEDGNGTPEHTVEISRRMIKSDTLPMVG